MWKGSFSYDLKTWKPSDDERKTDVFVEALNHFRKNTNGKPFASLETNFSYKHIFPTMISENEVEFAYVSNPDPPNKENYGFFKLTKAAVSPKASPKAKGSPKASDIKATAHRWAAMYNKGFEPPAWSLERVGSADWNRRAKLCRVYAPKSVNPAALAAVVSEREPVNIGMNRPYKPLVDSGYERLYKQTKTLPPNFALYMPALMSKQKNVLVHENVYHVLNSIGYAFDAVSQVDYKYFNMNSFTEAKKRELRDRLADTLNLAFQCVADIGLRKICLCYLGGVSFAEKFKPSQFDYKDVFFDALKQVLTPKVLATVDEINMLGYDSTNYLIDTVGTELKELVNQKGKICRLLGRIPDILTTDMLFLNAWDPHSVVGNGNGRDDTLDGFFGRLSDMGYMSIPEINRSLLENVRYV